MKQKQTGSAHVILLGILVVLLGGTLTHSLLKTLDAESNIEPIKQQSTKTADPTKKPEDVKDQTFAEFSDFRVRFPTSIMYTLKRNSGTGNMAGYWISIDSLAQTCTTPDRPWFGYIGQYTPSDLVENGPETGKTFGQIFEGQGKTIDGKLYVFKTMTALCTRGESNPAVEQAAEKLKLEIQNLEAY